MKIFVLLTTLIISLSVFAKDVERKVDNFSKLFVKSKFQVSIIKADENKVVINTLSEEADPEILITEVKNNILEIYTKKKNFKDKEFHVTVYYKNIAEIRVKNDAEVFTEPNVTVKGDSISLFCQVGGKIKVGVEADKLSATIKQGGSILLHGKADTFYPKIFTGGRISSSKLVNETCHAQVKVGGEMIVRPKKYLNAIVSTGGTIKYQGNPEKIDEKITLGGTIKKIK